jgi:hypothetical protein
MGIPVFCAGYLVWKYPPVLWFLNLTLQSQKRTAGSGGGVFFLIIRILETENRRVRLFQTVVAKEQPGLVTGLAVI